MELYNDVFKETIKDFSNYVLQNVDENTAPKQSDASHSLDDVMRSWQLFTTAVPVRLKCMQPHEMNRRVRKGVVMEMVEKMVRAYI